MREHTILISMPYQILFNRFQHASKFTIYLLTLETDNYCHSLANIFCKTDMEQNETKLPNYLMPGTYLGLYSETLQLPLKITAYDDFGQNDDAFTGVLEDWRAPSVAKGHLN